MYPKYHKYGNRKTEVAGQVFDSQKEAERYCELKLLERVGHISNLRTQVPFVVIPAQTDEHGKVIEKAVTYIADFVFNNQSGGLVVEDTKGYKRGTAYQLYSIKRKLMLQVYGIRVQEV